MDSPPPLPGLGNSSFVGANSFDCSKSIGRNTGRVPVLSPPWSPVTALRDGDNVRGSQWVQSPSPGKFMPPPLFPREAPSRGSKDL
eukprot:2409188-Pyramimonas_sp.AAC.1